MNIDQFNEIMTRLDSISEKLETVGIGLYQQALVVNYVYAYIETFMVLLIISIFSISLYKITRKGAWEYNGWSDCGEATTPSTMIFTIFAVFSFISIVAYVPMAISDIALRFSAPSIGAIKILMNTFN